jgi:hypothetical protein
VHSCGGRSPGLGGRDHVIGPDGDGDPCVAIGLLHAHHLSPAVEANGVVRTQVFKDQGTLEGISRPKHLGRDEEHPADTDVTGDARPVSEFHQELDPKALRPTPVWPELIHGAVDLQSGPAPGCSARR